MADNFPPGFRASVQSGADIDGPETKQNDAPSPQINMKTTLIRFAKQLNKFCRTHSFRSGVSRFSRRLLVYAVPHQRSADRRRSRGVAFILRGGASTLPSAAKTGDSGGAIPIASALGASTWRQRSVYDAVDDFSVAKNPNGAWSYGYSPDLTGGADFQFTRYDRGDGVPTAGQWRRQCCEYPKIHGAQQLFGDTGTMLYLHPSEDPNARLSVLRWTAPAAGTYQFDGQFTRGNTGRKDVGVFLNGSAITLGRLDEPGETRLVLTSLTLKAGDTVDFTSDIADDGQGSDSTGIQMRITTVNTVGQLWDAGRDFQANEKPDRAGETKNVNATAPAWSYGSRNSAAGTAFTPYTQAQHSNAIINEEIEGFFDGANLVTAANAGAAPYVRNAGFGNHKPVFPGQLLLHPSHTNAFPVVRWTAPAAGSYRISCEVD